MLLDLHTHQPAPRPQAIISCGLNRLPPAGEWPGQLYSVGIHPWDAPATGLDGNLTSALEEAAGREDVVAIGECGIDTLHEGASPLFSQLLVLRTHIGISERVGKPLILHCVKGFDAIISLRKEFRPRQRWVIHGFRGKPTVAAMLLKAGVDLCFGERFNPESVAITPPENIFAETDESPLPIEEIISRLNEANPAVTPALINANTLALINHKYCKIIDIY